MTSRFNARRVWAVTGIVMALAVVGLVLLLAPHDWNHLRGSVARVISASSGRTVHITGNLRVHLFSLNPRASVEGLELGNFPGAKSGSKAFVDHLDVNVRLLPPRRFTLHARSGATQIDAKGRMANPFVAGSYQAAVTMAGHDMADLYYLTGFAVPNTPPYKFSAVVHGVGRKLFLHDLQGEIGESDVHGNVAVDFSGPRRRIEGDLASRSLDLVDLAPALGAPARSARAPSLFPDAQLQADRLRAMDGDLQFHADSIRTRKLPLRKVVLHLRLESGVLLGDPVAFTLPQGELTGRVRLDARGAVPTTEVDGRITGVKLEQFKPRNGKPPPLEGLLRGRAHIGGPGGSVHDFISNADGNLTAVVPRGEIREALVELTGINVARGLGLLITKDQERTGVRCGVADFAMHHGTLRAKSIVFDTDDVLIDGGGEIDLAGESFDLAIKGHPKKLRLLRVKSPIVIRGPLRKPQVGLESGDALKQTGFAAALASIAAPLAAVLAFVDPGLADDADCGALLAEAKSKGAPVKTAEIADAKRR